MNNQKQFVKSNSINVNETSKWIGLIEKYIKEFNLKSHLIENEYGTGIEVFSEEEVNEIEAMLYQIEEDCITLHYIFEGNVYIRDGFNE